MAIIGQTKKIQGAAFTVTNSGKYLRTVCHLISLLKLFEASLRSFAFVN